MFKSQTSKKALKVLIEAKISAEDQKISGPIQRNKSDSQM